MKRIQIHKWIIEYDFNKTKEFYKSYHLITEGCECLNCKNFVEPTPFLPKAVVTFFDSLGIDPRKEGEVSEYCENEDGTHLYGGFFHIVGRLISGPDVWNKNDESGTVTSLDKDLYKIDNFRFGFTNEKNLVRDGFPEPILQIEFEGIVPWVIPE